MDPQFLISSRQSAKEGRFAAIGGVGRGGRPLARIHAVEALEARALLTAVAVQAIKDIKTSDQYPAQLTPAGSNLFYVVEDSTNSGQDLVVTNAGGTQVLKDFPEVVTSGSSSPTELTAIGDDVYFTTSAGSSSAFYNQLWRSDGTAGGTVQVSIPGTTIITTFEGLADLDGTLIAVVNAGTGADLRQPDLGHRRWQQRHARGFVQEDVGTLAYASPDARDRRTRRSTTRSTASCGRRAARRATRRRSAALWPRHWSWSPSRDRPITSAPRMARWSSAP